MRSLVASPPLSLLQYFSARDRLNHSSENTNCSLVEGYESVKHCLMVPFVLIRKNLSVKYDTTWTPFESGVIEECLLFNILKKTAIEHFSKHLTLLEVETERAERQT